ncbi:hypothetical protein MAPG_02688 [Magnaporthiopsis poae ATCC 64411]|uniref:Mid2 domain-containing protein n=1 Tax=Magnaporthiopsis poae (strain ATCC 64411 / 73-15) TaxID=644358 RepID=A0A0C4DS18_MAGP6|nr:hypothetical protein MAPG_02688 [Magnaporthiopsis poae ATCC 64411]
MRSRKAASRPTMAAAVMALMVVPSLAAAAAMPPSHDDDDGVPAPALRMFPEPWLPLETGHAVPDPARGFTPKPTPPPGHPDLGFMELAKRQVKSVTGYSMPPATCGFISSSRAAGAFTCRSEGATCSNSGSYLGCCASKTCASVLTSCVPSSLASRCSASATRGVLCCTASDRGFCSTYVMSRSKTPRSTLTLLVCHTAAGVGTLLDFPVNYSSTSSSSGSKRTTTPPTKTTTPTPSSSSSRSSSSTTSPTNRDAGASTNTPGPGGQSEQQQQQRDSPAVGAIVGGVVGGVAVLALAAVAIFLMVRRARSKGAPKVQQQQQPPPMTPQTFPPPGSSFHTSAVSPNLSPYPSPVPFTASGGGGGGGGGGSGGGFVPQGYPTAAGYMVPPQQHQQQQASPYSSVAGDSMFAYPSMTQYGGSPMAPNPSPEMPLHGGDPGTMTTATMATSYSAYHPGYVQQMQAQQPLMEYKAYSPYIPPQAGPPPPGRRNQGAQEMA